MPTIQSLEDAWPHVVAPVPLSTPSTSGMACDLEVAASVTRSIAAPRELSFVKAAWGGALGALLAFSLVAGAFALFEESSWNESSGGAMVAVPPAAAREAHEKVVGAITPDVLLKPAAAPAVLVQAPPPAVRPAPPRHRPQRHVRRSHSPVVPGVEFTNALARAELETSLP